MRLFLLLPLLSLLSAPLAACGTIRHDSDVEQPITEQREVEAPVPDRALKSWPMSQNETRTQYWGPVQAVALDVAPTTAPAFPTIDTGIGCARLADSLMLAEAKTINRPAPGATFVQ